MGATDFSAYAYSYCDHPDDFGLEKFALQPEDLEMKACGDTSFYININTYTPF
jgi:hypothetical protein